MQEIAKLAPQAQCIFFVMFFLLIGWVIYLIFNFFGIND
jgi:hypothetical protein